jgi:hypothetical protein
MPSKTVVIERGEYRGNPTVSIRKDTVEMDRYPFSFGWEKQSFCFKRWNRSRIS